MFQAGPYGYQVPPLQQYQQFQGQVNLPSHPLQQPINQAYQQQAVYPPVYPQYWQQPVYQGYQQQWEQPPLQPPPVYYQPPQRPQQQRASQSEYGYEYEPTMEELHWASLGIYDAPLTREDDYILQPQQPRREHTIREMTTQYNYISSGRRGPHSEEFIREYIEDNKRFIRQQELKKSEDIRRKIEELDREKEQSDLQEKLERVTKKEPDVEKEKLTAHNVPSTDDEVIVATEEAKDEEEKIDENKNNLILQSQSRKTTSNNSYCFPLQVVDPMEHITLNTNISKSVAQEEHEKVMMDEKLQLVPSKSIVDMLTPDFIFPPCLDISIKQNIVIICNFNVPSITYTVVSSHVQNFLIKHELDNQKLLCINWKTRKKSKRAILGEEGDLIIVSEQMSHLVFAWKPGLDSWIGVAGKIMKNARRKIRKFDGVHPWTPNIC